MMIYEKNSRKLNQERTKTMEKKSSLMTTRNELRPALYTLKNQSSNVGTVFCHMIHGAEGKCILV